MTEPTLEQIEKALEEATPGPWRREIDWTIRSTTVPEYDYLPGVDDGRIVFDYASDVLEADAHLIAHSPEWLAYLLNRVKDAQAVREALDGHAAHLELEVVVLREALKAANADRDRMAERLRNRRSTGYTRP